MNELKKRNRVLFLIVAATGIWVVAIAVGAFLFQGRDWTRFAIALTPGAALISIWTFLLLRAEKK